MWFGQRAVCIPDVVQLATSIYLGAVTLMPCPSPFSENRLVSFRFLFFDSPPRCTQPCPALLSVLPPSRIPARQKSSSQPSIPIHSFPRGAPPAGASQSVVLAERRIVTWHPIVFLSTPCYAMLCRHSQPDMEDTAPLALALALVSQAVARRLR